MEHLKDPVDQNSIIITKEQLEYLSSISFSWSEIAQVLGVYRRRVEFGLLSEPLLISTVQRICSEFPDIGESIGIYPKENIQKFVDSLCADLSENFPK